ncbi:class I SAM-dependent methyltransferase [Dactylosporangium sp. CS-033363]|uniref:class I SAM-dependent methyltransferase n=1 Tax=Dactylosporangium sp. CS-033363 TaxID=3239935 RepID=UPI003D90BB83
MTDEAFTPALGRLAPTFFYDSVVALTRERRWRGLVARLAAPKAGEVVVDVGCGTGSLGRLLSTVEPAARIIGVDPDPAVLAMARRKTGKVEWRLGKGDALDDILGPGEADVVVSSLVLHQCPMPVKRSILRAMGEVLRPGGRLVIADYGLQRTRAMRLAFRTVQFADGRADTQPNADGVVPGLIAEAGFRDVCEAAVVPTVTGSISIYTAGGR